MVEIDRHLRLLLLNNPKKFTYQQWLNVILPAKNVKKTTASEKFVFGWCGPVTIYEVTILW